MNTTHGQLDSTTLQRTTGFEDRPNEFVVWEEWRKTACDVSCTVCADAGNPKPANGLVLVRRDAHVILKHASVTATGAVASIGG